MKFATAFLILLFAANGCVTHLEPLEAPHPESQPEIPDGPRTNTDKRVVVAPELERAIRIVRLTSITGKEGFLKIQVNVQNLTDAFVKFSYRIDWFDKEGTELPMASSAEMPWALLKRETSFLAMTGPTPSAKDFRITFKGLNP